MLAGAEQDGILRTGRRRTGHGHVVERRRGRGMTRVERDAADRDVGRRAVGVPDERDSEVARQVGAGQREGLAG